MSTRMEDGGGIGHLNDGDKQYDRQRARWMMNVIMNDRH